MYDIMLSLVQNFIYILAFGPNNRKITRVRFPWKKHYQSTIIFAFLRINVDIGGQGRTDKRYVLSWKPSCCLGNQYITIVTRRGHLVSDAVGMVGHLMSSFT